MLEYYEEIEYEDFDAKKYSLIDLYFSEDEAQKAKEKIGLQMNIGEEFLFISASKVGRI